jgi:hypothetical protein
MVFEADTKLVDSLSKGDCCIKIDRGGIAYLSTVDDTFQIRRLENSNTQLLVESRETSGASSIVAGITGIIKCELVTCQRLPDDEIRDIFNRHHGDQDIFPYLLHGSIWSEAAIIRHLRSEDNFFLENLRWRRIDDDTFFADLESLLNICAIVGGGPDFNSEEVWMHMNESGEAECRPPVSLSYVQYLLSRLTEGPSRENKGESDWPLAIALDQERVILHRGRQALFALARGDSVDIHEFIRAWKELLESSVAVDAYLLDDEALVNMLPNVLQERAIIDNDFIVWLDTRSLPIDSDKRVERLFQVKPKWAKAEFESFFLPLLTAETKPESVLLKSCRLDDSLCYSYKL